MKILLALALCGTLAAAPADPAILKSEFIYESGPYPQVHASTITETPGGLVAAWFGGTKERDPDVAIWVSRQVDGKWTEGTEAANGIQYTGANGGVHRHACWNPVLFQPENGPLLLFYKVGPDPRNWWGMLTTSEDHGKTWAFPRRLPEDILGPVKNRPVQLPDGSLVCPVSEEAPEGRVWTVHFEHTSDLGKTWRRTPALNDGKAIQAIQPSILTLGDGKLLAIGRTRQNHIFEVASDDNGLTWDKMKLGTLPNNNSGTDAVTLADGRHLIVYNHTPPVAKKRNTLRTPLNVAVSRNGRDWQAAIVLEDEPGEYSYPSIIQTGDGRVHITYTWKRERVKHVVIDPEKINARDFTAGNWPE